MNIIGGGSPLNYVPMYWEFEIARYFTDFIRANALEILNWMNESHIPKSKAMLGVHIVEDIEDESYWEWNFIINCKNIREFKTYINLGREEFEASFESHVRDEKIRFIK
jgi:hypothetical protein